MSELKVTKDQENKSLTLERTFDATRDRVWQAFADRALFEKWWGPEGWETTTPEFNFVPGGRVHYGMKCTDESQAEWYRQTSWGVMEIQTIDEGNSFTYVDYFSDENGKLNTDMPALAITNELIERDGKTTLVSKSTAADYKQIEQLLEMGMLEGFESQLRKLDEMLV